MFDAVLATTLAINSSLEGTRSMGGGRREAVRRLQEALSSVAFVGASVSGGEGWREGGGVERGEGRWGGEWGGEV